MQKELAEERQALKSYIQGDALLGRFAFVWRQYKVPELERIMGRAV